jgi:heme/copper-type cytochrome/quinol oxidase subunit 2
VKKWQNGRKSLRRLNSTVGCKTNKRRRSFFIIILKILFMIIILIIIIIIIIIRYYEFKNTNCEFS